MLIEQMKCWHECAVKNNVVQDIKDSAYAIAWLEKQGEKHIDRELSNLLNRVICRFINDPNIPYSERDEVSKKIIPYVEQLEKQGDDFEEERVFRPLPGCDIYSAAKSAVERQKSRKKIILAFNGAYIPVDRKTADEIVNEYYSWIKKQGE